jgi:CsoR family transcriptional regulator, copper-sensing transcriptional repressor
MSQRKTPRTDDENREKPHPSHAAALPRINRVVGQLQGIQKMIEEERYCVDILIQFRAAMSALRAVETEVFQKHLEHCVQDALSSRNERVAQEKIHELTDLLIKRTSL